MAKPPAGSSLLFGALADSGRIKQRKNGSYRMVLKGVDEIDWFTDRPNRVAGECSPKKLVKKWESLFGYVEPNAQATFEVGSKQAGDIRNVQTEAEKLLQDTTPARGQTSKALRQNSIMQQLANANYAVMVTEAHGNSERPLVSQKDLTTIGQKILKEQPPGTRVLIVVEAPLRLQTSSDTIAAAKEAAKRGTGSSAKAFRLVEVRILHAHKN